MSGAGFGNGKTVRGGFRGRPPGCTSRRTNTSTVSGAGTVFLVDGFSVTAQNLTITGTNTALRLRAAACTGCAAINSANVAVARSSISGGGRSFRHAGFHGFGGFGRRGVERTAARRGAAGGGGGTGGAGCNNPTFGNCNGSGAAGSW